METRNLNATVVARQCNLIKYHIGHYKQEGTSSVHSVDCFGQLNEDSLPTGLELGHGNIRTSLRRAAG